MVSSVIKPFNIPPNLYMTRTAFKENKKVVDFILFNSKVSRHVKGLRSTDEVVFSFYDRCRSLEIRTANHFHVYLIFLKRNLIEKHSYK